MDDLEQELNYPVLVRPSYVLSGTAMKVAYNRQALENFLKKASEVSPDHPVLVTEFIEGAREIDMDGVAQNGELKLFMMSEHLENAGIHSGDATLIFPAQKVYLETARQVREITQKIVKEFNLNGPFNIQFLSKNNNVKVIECNPRASRSFPFVSKVSGLNLAEVASRVIMGETIDKISFNDLEIQRKGVNSPMFSFKRLDGVDPMVGIEMTSTGEVGCIGDTLEEALILSVEATGLKRPQKGILISSGGEHQKLKFLQSMPAIKRLGLPVFATEGTADYLQKHGYEVQKLSWPNQEGQDVLSAIKEGLVDFVVNIPKSHQRKELSNGSKVRQACVKFNASLVTTVEMANLYFQALDKNINFSDVKSL